MPQIKKKKYWSFFLSKINNRIRTVWRSSKIIPGTHKKRVYQTLILIFAGPISKFAIFFPFCFLLYKHIFTRILSCILKISCNIVHSSWVSRFHHKFPILVETLFPTSIIFWSSISVCFEILLGYSRFQ